MSTTKKSDDLPTGTTSVADFNDTSKYVIPKGLYKYYFGEDSETDVTEKTDPTKCGHTWKKYLGFNERYEFCEKCDSKKPYEEK